jgi:hypothetical protein
MPPEELDMLPEEDMPLDDEVFPDGALDPWVPEDEEDMPELLPVDAGALAPAAPTFPEGVWANARVPAAMPATAIAQILTFLKLMKCSFAKMAGQAR